MKEKIFAIIKKLFNPFKKSVPELSQSDLTNDRDDASIPEQSTDLSIEEVNNPSIPEQSTDLSIEEVNNPSIPEQSTALPIGDVNDLFTQEIPTEDGNNTYISGEATNISEIWGSEDDIELKETIIRYGSTLSNLLDNDTVEANLPYADKKSLPLYKGIIDYLESEKQKWNKSDPDECEEINRLEEIIGICKKKVEKVEQIISPTVGQFTEESNDESIKLIFATTATNNVCFINDLGNIDKTYDKYRRIKPLLLGIKRFRCALAGNQEKYRLFKSSRKNLQGIREAKEYQIRIFFKPLKAGSNVKCVYVYGIFIKKDNSSSYIETVLSNRKQAQEDEYQTILEILKSNDEKSKSELYSKHEQIEEKIINILNDKKIGEKGNEQQAAR